MKTFKLRLNNVRKLYIGKKNAYKEVNTDCGKTLQLQILSEVDDFQKNGNGFDNLGTMIVECGETKKQYVGEYTECGFDKNDMQMVDDYIIFKEK